MFFQKNDIEDFKKYVPVNAGFGFSTIEIYLNAVDRDELAPLFGKTFLNEIQELFEAEESASDLDEPVKEFVELLRIASANLALLHWLPIGQVSVSQAGIQIASSENQKTAFQWQIKDIEDKLAESGFNALDKALQLLEDNINNSAFATYKSSEEFKANNYLFVPFATDFCKHYSLFSTSRINYKKMLSVIKKVEDFEIKPAIGESYFNDLKTKLQAGETLGTNAKKIVELIQPALVNLTVARAIGDLSIAIDSKGLLQFDNTGGRQTIDSKKTAGDGQLFRLATTAERDGKIYMKQLRDYLETHKDDYPLYTSDAKYTAPADVPDLNSEASGKKKFYTGI